MDPDTSTEEGDEVELVTDPPPRRRLGLLVANLAVIAAALTGVYVLAVDDDPEAAPPGTTVPPSSTSVPTVERVLALMPASPIDGKQSQQLPVAAVPRFDLVEGQVVTVVAKGFAPGERVGAVLCTSEAAIAGVDACDLGTGFDRVAYATASGEGVVRVDVPIRSVVETPLGGAVDCRSGPERCLVAVGAVGDYDRSGGAVIGFVGQPPFPVPALTVGVPGPYDPAQSVDVVATGLLWPREAELRLCAGERCVSVARGRVAPDGTFAGAVTLPWAFTLVDGTVVTCELGCTLSVTYLALPDSSRAPLPATIPIEFTAVDPAAPPDPVAPTTVQPPTIASPTTVRPPTVPPPTTVPPTTGVLPPTIAPPSTIAVTTLPPAGVTVIEVPPATDAVATTVAAG